jgi:DNA topoisomerase VI subunit B
MSNEEIAQKMSKGLREISVAEFFEKNRHLLGFDNPAKALLTVVKEICDNSLDACEEAEILPEITIRINQKGEDRFKIVVQDNGPGIVKEKIPRVFGKLLYGSKFHKMAQGRGQQGIGVSAAVLYSQLTTGKPTIIRSRISKNKPVHEFHLRIDTIKNEPHITKDIVYDGSFPDHGIYIEMEIEGSFKRGKRSVDEYMKQTALANPAAKISYRNPYKEKFSYPRIVNKLPKKAKSIKPHPYGVELGVFERMAKGTHARSVAGFMTTDFSRVGLDTAKKVCRIAKVNPSTPSRNLGHAELEKVWRNLQKAKLMKPPLDCLSPIGSSVLEKAVIKDTKCEFVASITRPPCVYRGNPFGIEVCIGYGGDLVKEKSAEIVRIANRVPLIHEASACAITKAIKGVDWKHYRMDHNNGIPTGPFIIMIHMYSTWIPYTSEGKEAIDAYPVILKEVKLAIQDCARKMGRFLAGKRKRHLEKQRHSLFERYIPELAISLEKLSGEKKTVIISGLERTLKKDEVGKNPEKV